MPQVRLKPVGNPENFQLERDNTVHMFPRLHLDFDTRLGMMTILVHVLTVLIIDFLGEIGPCTCHETAEINSTFADKVVFGLAEVVIPKFDEQELRRKVDAEEKYLVPAWRLGVFDGFAAHTTWRIVDAQGAVRV